MPLPIDAQNHSRRHVRLETLVRLRWLAVIGQTTAVLVVYYGLEFKQPLAPDRAAWLLAFDIAELAVLLFLTGGLENPFAFLFLGPVLLSATALPARFTLLLGAFAISCATVLIFIHYPLPWDSEDPLQY